MSYTFIIILTLLLSLQEHGAVKNPGQGSGFFIVDGEEYELSHAYLYDWEARRGFKKEGVRLYGIVFASPGLTMQTPDFYINGFSGTGHFVSNDLVVKSSIENLPGTYRADTTYYGDLTSYDSLPSNLILGFSFTTIEMEFTDPPKWQLRGLIVGGTNTINKTETGYSFRFNYTLSEGQQVTGEYSGPLIPL